jgi:short-subunit dehydrogenase
MQIKDSVIIVTGASAGIGADTVRQLAKKGANVVLTARRQERLDDLVAELREFSGERMALVGNIQDEEFCRHLIQQTITKFGHLDVLINNAGLGHGSLVSNMPFADVETIFNTNVYGLLHATRAAIPHFKQQGKGQIINVSSIVGQRPLLNGGAYTASKAAVNFFSRTLRMELRPHHILVTLVYPGLTQTEFNDVKLGTKKGNRLNMNGVPAKKVAVAIVKAIESEREEVYATWFDWGFTHANRLFPRLMDRIVGRFAIG